MTRRPRDERNVVGPSLRSSESVSPGFGWEPSGTLFGMRIQVLGPLQIERDGRTLEVGSQSQRRLVSALTIHHGDVVSIDALVDLLWPDDPPATARTTVQKDMSRLRGRLG